MADLWNRVSVPPAALTIVSKTEGCVLHPYRDGAGVWTIGWGSTFDPAGMRVTGATHPITQAQADSIRNGQLIRWVSAVTVSIPGDLTGNQAAALVSFTHNLGPNALDGSMIQKMLAAGNADLAGNQLNGWAVSAGKVVLGLLRRREFERRVWCDEDPTSAYAAAWAMSEAELMPLYTRAFTEAAAWRAAASPLIAAKQNPPHPIAKPVPVVSPQQSEADALDAEFNPTVGA